MLRITRVEQDIAGHLHSFVSAGRSVQTPPYRFRLSARCRDTVGHIVGIVGPRHRSGTSDASIGHGDGVGVRASEITEEHTIAPLTSHVAVRVAA